MVDTKKDQEKSKIPFLSDFTVKNLEKSAEMEIKPKLTIELGIEKMITVVIMSEPYQIVIPIAKRIDNKEKIWVIDLEFNEVLHQCTCESGSFRYQLGVLMSKLDIVEPSELINLPIKIWKTLEQLNTPTFKGKAEMYHIAMI